MQNANQRWGRVVRVTLFAAVIAIVSGCAPALKTTDGSQASPASVATGNPASRPVAEPMLQKDFTARSEGGYRATVMREPQRGQRRGLKPWRQKLQAKKDFNLASGSMQFRLQRLPAPVPGETEWDTLFSLVDGSGKQVLTAYIVSAVPETYVGPSRTGLNLYSETMPADVWGFWWPFPKDLKVGQEYRLEFRWSGEGTAVLLDGRELPASYGDFLGAEPLPRGGKNPGLYFRDIRMLQVGADPFPGDNSPMDANLVQDFVIY